MDLSIVIVSYNVKDKLRANLESIFKSKVDFSFEVFVVDNDSGDFSAEMVESDFPQVKLIKNDKNLGFSRANNLAIEKSEGDFILLLNPDMQVFKDTLSKSLSFAKSNSEAIVSSCKLVDEKGTLVKHVRRFPGLFDQLMIVLKIPHIFPSVLKSYLMPNFNYDLVQEVDSVRGSFFMINKEAYQKVFNEEFPFLDERYFIWFEEVDFCRKIRESGYKVLYNSDVSCLDYVGQSFSLLNRKKTQVYFRDSMLKYFNKWESPYKYFILKIFWPLGFLLVNILKK